MKLKELIPGCVVEDLNRRIQYIGMINNKYVGKIISTSFSWEKSGAINDDFSGDYNGWSVVSISNGPEENSIEHFKKKIEETKTELVRLENTLKGLEDSKRMKEYMNQDKITEAKNEIARLEKLVKTLEDEQKSKELKEQISKLIPGNFYTVNTNDSKSFTGRFSNFNNQQIFFTHPETTTKYGFGIEVIKEIIHRPDFTNEFNNLMKKLETYNKEI